MLSLVGSRVLLVLWLLGAASGALNAADDSAILRRSGELYYNLNKEGLAEFRCDVYPDYEGLVDKPGAAAAGKDLLPFLKQVHFEISVAANGASTVSRKTDSAPPGEQIAQRLRAVMTGVEQTLTGFFNVWGQFQTGRPIIDPAKPHEIKQTDEGYLITQLQGTLNVAVRLTRDLLMTELKIDFPTGVEFLTHPTFLKTANGYLVSDLETMQVIPQGTVHTDIAVEYGAVEGLQLPRRVTVKTDGSALPAAVKGSVLRFQFTNYVIKRK